MKSALVLALCLSAALATVLAQQTNVPTVSADNTSVVHPPQPLEPDMKGYGTRGVEGKTLADMLASCKAPTQLSRVQASRCAQLRRSMKTQPDGTVEETLKQVK